MRHATRRFAAAAMSLLAVIAPARARAVEVPEFGGHPMLIDITNTSIFNYHFNNRNDVPGNVATRVDDDYGEWLNRLNIQASWWRLRLGARLDSAAFVHTLSAADVTRVVNDELPTASITDRNDFANQYYRELHSRYQPTFYPSKLFVGYSQPGVDVTVGDFYAQLGRGLVFSVRKIDELAVDTTVRGIKVVADRGFGDIHLAATAFAGQMNPLRVDETSGRILHGTGSPLFFGFPRSNDLLTYGFGEFGSRVQVVDRARPSYLEDTAAGGHLELGTKHVILSGNTSVLLRKSYSQDYLQCLAAGKDATKTADTQTLGQCAAQFPDFTSTDESQMHNRILTFSGAVTVPSILKHGDLYVEVAGQQLRDGHLLSLGDSGNAPLRTRDLSGYAVYAGASASGGPVSVSIEGKHYRSFFPLSGNIDTGTKAFGAPEFGLVTYSQLPTVEPIYTEPVSGGAPNVCITGGRGRVDYRFNRAASLYTWVGRYLSWSEIPEPNPECDTSIKKQTNTWDTAVGTELSLEHGQSHFKAWIGARITDRAVAAESNAGVTDTFYREGYLRYDFVKHLVGKFSIQVQGFHRHRFEPVSFQKPWTEGENYTALQWSPHLSAVFGYEYLAKDGCEPPRPATAELAARDVKNLCHFFNGGIQWRSHGSGEGTGKVLAQIFDTVGVFVGQRRGALRCVSGVCRQFPPFEGAKLEITSRF